MELTQKDADKLINMPKIPIDIGGGLDFDSRKKVVRLESLGQYETFFLNVTPGYIDITKVTYQTRARRSTILVRLDINGPPHRNPDDTEVPCPHIHIYREGYGTKWAYPLTDDFLECNNLWDYLVEFCNYCNITSNPFNEPTVTF